MVNRFTTSEDNSSNENVRALAARLDELETRVAFQDDLINTLSEQLSRQELDIRELWEAKKQLNSQLKEVSSSNIRKEEEETPPPHW